MWASLLFIGLTAYIISGAVVPPSNITLFKLIGIVTHIVGVVGMSLSTLVIFTTLVPIIALKPEYDTYDTRITSMLVAVLSALLY